MKQILRLSIIGDDYEHRAEMKVWDGISLNDETYQWLKSAFMGIGFNPKCVEEFFNDSNGEQP